MEIELTPTFAALPLRWAALAWLASRSSRLGENVSEGW
jgi:hypothetical protein